MEFLEVFLPVTLYSVAIVLVIVLIVLGLKAIETLTKLNTLIDDAQEKLNAMNSFFSIMELVTDKVSVVTDTVASAVTGVITGVFRKLKRKKESIEDE